MPIDWDYENNQHVITRGNTTLSLNLADFAGNAPVNAKETAVQNFLNAGKPTGESWLVHFYDLTKYALWCGSEDNEPTSEWWSIEGVG